MKKTIIWMVIMAMLSTGMGYAEEKTAEKSGSVTIISPDGDGGIQVISKDVAPDGVKKDVKTREDKSARKARVIVVPAAWSSTALEQSNLRDRQAREASNEVGLSGPGIKEDPEYTTYVVNALVNCRKFDVLERESLTAVAAELDFAETDYADINKVTRMGQMLNADYVIIPEVQDFEIRYEHKDVPFMPTASERYRGIIVTHFRTVAVATSRLASSGTDKVESLRRQKTDETARMAFHELLRELYQQSAMEQVANIIDAVYPMKVMTISGDTCVINRGEDAVEVGEMLAVYRPGEVMVDPDTKENLGYNEVRVGKVKVTEVKPKTCSAEIIEKDEPIKEMYICRRMEKEKAVKAEPAPAID